jgi:hypothetical protein
VYKLVTAAKADAPARRRGRPRKGEGNAVKSAFDGGLVDTLRNDLREIIGVCQTCGHFTNPVQPIADEVGITPVTLGKFIKGEAGVSMDTFNALWGFASQRKAQAEASEASEGATA